MSAAIVKYNGATGPVFELMCKCECECEKPGSGQSAESVELGDIPLLSFVA